MKDHSATQRIYRAGPSVPVRKPSQFNLNR